MTDHQERIHTGSRIQRCHDCGVGVLSKASVPSNVFCAACRMARKQQRTDRPKRQRLDRPRYSFHPRPWRVLAVSILAQAVDDWRNNPHERGDLIAFFNSDWCDFLCGCLDRDAADLLELYGVPKHELDGLPLFGGLK